MDGPQIPEEYAAYPRGYGVGPFGPAPRRVRMDAIGDAWNILKSDWGTWVGTTLVLIGISIAASAPQFLYSFIRGATSRPASDPFLQPSDVLAVTAVLGCITHWVLGIVTAGVQKLGLKKVRGEYGTFSDIFSFQGRLGQLALAELILCPIALLPYGFGVAATIYFKGTDVFTLSMIAVGFQLIGALLASFVYAWVVFVPLLVLDGGMTVGEAYRASFDAAGGKILPIFGLLFVVGFLASVGACACLVGLLFTAPLYYVTRAVLYHDFFRRVSVAPSAPSNIGAEPPTAPWDKTT